MTAKTTKHPDPRFISKFSAMLGIRTYGEDNLYPQLVQDITRGSSTTSSCLSRYASFLEGDGVENVDLSKAVVNGCGDTWDDVCRWVANDLARFGGFAVHARYNAVGEIIAITPMHFEDLRLAERNEAGKTTRIAYHPDWTGKQTRAGRKLKVSADTIEWFDVFNPDAVQAQMMAAGSVEEYKGQILYVSMAGNMEYPLPIYDECITPISTDEGIDNVLYRNARNNFMTAGAIVHKRGYTGSEHDKDEFGEQLDTFQGDTNACSIMDITVESDEDEPRFVSFRGESFDKEFVETSKRVVESIYTAFKQEPWLCIRFGKVGFGGDVIKDAYNVYNLETDTERRVIGRALTRVFNAWEQRSNWGDTEIYIKPKKYVV